MRTNHIRNNLKVAFILAPLLAGCPGAPDGGGKITLPPGGVSFPDCEDGSLLVTDDAGIVKCAKAPSGGRTNLPGSCGDRQALNSDGTNLTCVDIPSGGANPLNTRIDTLTTKTTDLTMKANNLKAGGGASYKLFAGVTTATVNGNMKGTTDNGFTGAAKMCADQFGAGSQMCTIQDIYHSVVQGKITSAMNIAKSWVYAPAWKNPISGSLDPLQGMGDTCGSLTYPTGDLRWTGTAFSTGTLRTTRWGVRIHGGSEAPCNQALPVACCK